MLFNNGDGYNFLYDRFENATEKSKTRQLYRSDHNAGKLLGANSHHVEKEKACLSAARENNRRELPLAITGAHLSLYNQKKI